MALRLNYLLAALLERVAVPLLLDELLEREALPDVLPDEALLERVALLLRVVVVPDGLLAAEEGLDALLEEVLVRSTVEEDPEEFVVLIFVLEDPLELTRLRVVWLLLEDVEEEEALRAGVAEVVLEGVALLPDDADEEEEVLLEAVDALLDGVAVLLPDVADVERDAVDAAVGLDAPVRVAFSTVVTLDALRISETSRAFETALAGVAAPLVEVLTRDLAVRALNAISGC